MQSQANMRLDPDRYQHHIPNLSPNFNIASPLESPAPHHYDSTYDSPVICPTLPHACKHRTTIFHPARVPSGHHPSRARMHTRQLRY